MNIIKKLLLLSIFILSPELALPSINSISNIFIFGDSLSDIGNFPMTKYPYHRQTDIRNQSFLVPPSNPVNYKIGSTYPLIDQPNITLSYPNVLSAYTYLPKQPRLGAHTYFRSIGWPQYLINDLFNGKQIIIPSMLIDRIRRKPPLFSVDYAWFSALTFFGCSGHGYTHPNQSCSYQQIRSHRNRYHDLLNKDIDDQSLVLIPGVLKQVQLFEQDVSSHKVIANSHSEYIILIASNDLNLGFEKLKSLKWSSMKHGFNIIHKIAASNTKQAISRLISGPSHAKHITIINLMDLGLTPYAYRNFLLRWFAHIITLNYNRQLQKLVSSIRLQHPAISIHIFSMFNLTKKLSQQAYFNATLGEQCNSSRAYLGANSPKLNCHINNKHAYLYWDEYHLTSLYYQSFAYHLKQFLVKHL